MKLNTLTKVNKTTCPILHVQIDWPNKIALVLWDCAIDWGRYMIPTTSSDIKSFGLLLPHAPCVISINMADQVAYGSVYKSIQLDLGLTCITYALAGQKGGSYQTVKVCCRRRRRRGFQGWILKTQNQILQIIQKSIVIYL